MKRDLPNVGPVFHRLWTKAVGTPGYNKAEWLQLCRVLQEAGMDRVESEVGETLSGKDPRTR